MKIILIKESRGNLLKKIIISKILETNIKYNLLNFNQEYSATVEKTDKILSFLQDRDYQKSIQINSDYGNFAFWVKSYQENSKNNSIKIFFKSYLSYGDDNQNCNLFRIPISQLGGLPGHGFNIGAFGKNNSLISDILFIDGNEDQVFENVIKICFSSLYFPGNTMINYVQIENLAISKFHYDNWVSSGDFLNNEIFKMLTIFKFWVKFYWMGDKLTLQLNNYKNKKIKLFKNSKGVSFVFQELPTSPLIDGIRTSIYLKPALNDVTRRIMTQASDVNSVNSIIALGEFDYNSSQGIPYYMESKNYGVVNANEFDKFIPKFNEQKFKNAENFEKLNKKGEIMIEIDQNKINFKLELGTIIKYENIEIQINELNLEKLDKLSLKLGDLGFGLISDAKIKEVKMEVL